VTDVGWLLEGACRAFLAFVRAYPVKEKSVQHIFNALALNLGHITRSLALALRETPKLFSRGIITTTAMPTLTVVMAAQGLLSNHNRRCHPSRVISHCAASAFVLVLTVVAVVARHPGLGGTHKQETHTSLLKLKRWRWRLCNADARSASLSGREGGGGGMSGMYRLIIGNLAWALDVPTDPGAYSQAALTAGNAAAQREQLVAEHKILQKSYNDYLG